MSNHPQPTAKPNTHSSIKETVTSLLIAFALAFVFRGFVVEAFVIPTGSMAPTLLGGHLELRSPATGYVWAAGPKSATNTGLAVPTQREITAKDPMSGADVKHTSLRAAWGDRIFVMKYLAPLYTPSRFDCVVFKNPTDPTMNYIKRLLGLPGEQVAIIDGDLFVRTPRADDPKDASPWTLPGWSVPAKPERAQRAMWQPVFSSAYAPIAEVEGYKPRWVGTNADGSSAGWTIPSKPGPYRYAQPGPTTLAWNHAQFPVLDQYPYNEISDRANTRGGYVPPPPFPVSDVRLSLGVLPKGPGLVVAGVVETRGHELRCEVRGRDVVLTIRPAGGGGEPRELAKGTLPAPLTPGRVTNLEFWHADQRLQLWSEGKLVASGSYAWTPEERVRNTLGVSIAQIASGTEASVLHSPAKTKIGLFRWEFSGSAFELYRVALDRDIHYRADSMSVNSRRMGPARATHPTTTMSLNAQQYFVCGDNSPASLDARRWDAPNPWVARIDPAEGVVPVDLMIGKAFFVYFPGMKRNGLFPVPDTGKMRWIW